MEPARLTPAELRELSTKYQALAVLRARRDAGNDAPSRADLRRLAALHPGCLRELDTLGADEILRRARALEAAADGAPTEAWMAWIVSYHRLMRAALAVKKNVGATRRDAPLDDQRVAALVETARAASGLPLTAAWIDAAARPPQGRLGVLVLRTLGEAFGVPADTIAAALFPARRRSPYTLT